MPRMIVCGVDDSEAASAVAETAKWLADGLGARLLLMHAIEEPRAKAEELLASVSSRLALSDDDEVRLVDGSPSERLLNAVDQEGAELLVVGSRGRGSVRSGLFGSVSRALATRARCPVAVIPEISNARDTGGAEATNGGSIVCGVDGSEHAVAAARLAGDLAARLGYRPVVVHALPDLKTVASYAGARSTTPPVSAQPDSQRREGEGIVDEAVSAVGGDVTAVVETGPPWEVLQLVADREAGRLLMVAARGHSAVRAAALGSVAARVAAASPLPVIVLPEPAEHAVGTGG